MRSYYETETEVSATRQVVVQLPDDVSPGKVRVTVFYEVENEVIESDIRDEKDRSMAEFLDNLPINYKGGLTPEEIQTRVDEERQSWDD
ncbi:MAG: hypothetical protein WA947_05230 [Phormidesmis sp.]